MKESQTRVKKRSEERDDLETVKAAAWAVFQHNNEGSNSNRHGHGDRVLVQQATRFKIEAQMKNELERRCMATEALPSWDAGSTLFDKYELDSVFKHLDFASQSADTHHKVSSDGSERYDNTTTEPAPIASSPGSNYHYADAHAQRPEQYSRGDKRSRNGYGSSNAGRPNEQHDWLETVDESQRFRGSYLESVDESLPLATAGSEDAKIVYGLGAELESPKPKLVMNIDMYDDLCKDVQEIVPPGKVFKTMQFLHTPNRWNMLNGRRCSFDTSPDDVQKSTKQSRKSKLLAIFRSKSAKDVTGAPKPTRQARIVPDDSAHKGRKARPHGALRKSGELVVSTADPHDSDSSDSASGDGYELAHEWYPASKGAGVTQGPAVALKSGSHMVRVPNFSRAVRLSSDMRNPNAEEGLRDHLRHGKLTYGHGAHGAHGRHGLPAPTRKALYSLNVTSPVQSPRRSMLNGSREDVELDDTQQYHHEYHHHYHHHHHHIAHQDDDYELTVQDIVRRVPRKSFEELAHRLSIEENTGSKAPRNSLDSLFFSTTTPGSKLFL